MAINPMQLIQMIQGGANPQQLMISILEQQADSNPIQKNLLTLAKNNDEKGIEEVVRNMAREKGINFDEAFNSFKSNLGL